MQRSSVSRMAISDYENNFIIESSETTEQIIMKPKTQAMDYGVVPSKVRVDIVKFEDVKEHLPLIRSPQHTGNLLYAMDSPFQTPEFRKSSHHQQNDEFDDINFCSIGSLNQNCEKSELKKPPNIGLLPFFIGNEGNVVWKRDNLHDLVTNLAKEIGNEFEQKHLTNQTLDKMTILIRLVRTMNVDQISEIAHGLARSDNTNKTRHFNYKNSKSRPEIPLRSSWMIFQNAVYHAGTGPALLSIERWIKEDMISCTEAQNAVHLLPKVARIPTTTYLQKVYVSY